MNLLNYKILLVIIVMALISTSYAAEREAYIKNIIGTVKVRKGQSPTWKDAMPNMVLKEKDAVRTYMESQVEIMTSEGSIIKLDENTTLEMSVLKEFGGGAQSTKVKILNGTVLANVKKFVNTGSKFDFETPTAVASIRGTIVGFDVTKEKTVIKVYEGEVLVSPIGSTSSITLSADQKTTIAKGDKTIKAESISGKEKSSIQTPETPPVAPTVDTTKKDTAVQQKIPIDSSLYKKNIDSTAIKQTGFADTSTKTQPEILSVSVNSPQDNLTVKPSASITISGIVLPKDAKVSVNGKAVTLSSNGTFSQSITAPSNVGDYEISVEAVYGTQSKTIVKRYSVIQTGEFFLSITKPADMERIGLPQVVVSGTTLPGAEVTAGSIKIPVSPNGSFSGVVPIPDEENQIDITIEAFYNGKTVKTTRRVIYSSELILNIASPQNGQVFNTPLIPVTGQVIPSTAELIVSDVKIPVMSNGKFSGVIKIPQEEGEAIITFEVTSPSGSKKEKRTVIYKKPIDDLKPEILPSSMPQISKTSPISFTVVDKTQDDEITFYKIKDGSKEWESGRPNSVYNLELDEGFHTYTVYAEDKAKNRSNTVTGIIGYISRMPTIKVRKPIGTEVIRIPPQTPSGAFIPQYTVMFSVLNVPDNDKRLIKQINVTNITTGQTVSIKEIFDLDLEVDINLKRGRNNIMIEVRDIADRIFSVKDLVVEVR